MIRGWIVGSDWMDQNGERERVVGERMVIVVVIFRVLMSCWRWGWKRDHMNGRLKM